MLGVLGEVAFEFLIEHLVAVVDIVDVLLVVYVHALSPKLRTLLYMLLQILRHLLHPVHILICSISNFLDSLEVGAIEGVLIEHIPAEDLAPLPFLEAHFLGSARLLERVLGFVLRQSK